MDAESGVIVAAALTNVAPDVGHLPALVAEVRALRDVVERPADDPTTVSADAGYFSGENAAHDGADLDHQAVRLRELHIDRAYLSSPLVRDRPGDLAIYCRAWPVRNGGRFPNTAFVLDWEQRIIRCPNGALLPVAPGSTVRFPTATCAACPLRDRCTTSTHGRSVTIRPDERLLVDLRRRQATPTDRATLRERVAVEHSLAHVGRWQGRRPRYRGARKNLFDLRRCAVVHNLHVIARLPQSNAA